MYTQGLVPGVTTAVPGSVDVILNLGDLTYGDDFSPLTTYYGNSYASGVNPLKWDSFQPMFQPALGNALFVTTYGNHEIEAFNGQQVPAGVSLPVALWCRAIFSVSP